MPPRRLRYLLRPPACSQCLLLLGGRSLILSFSLRSFLACSIISSAALLPLLEAQARRKLSSPGHRAARPDWVAWLFGSGLVRPRGLHKHNQRSRAPSSISTSDRDNHVASAAAGRSSWQDVLSNKERSRSLFPRRPTPLPLLRSDQPFTPPFPPALGLVNSRQPLNLGFGSPLRCLLSCVRVVRVLLPTSQTQLTSCLSR